MRFVNGSSTVLKQVLKINKHENEIGCGSKAVLYSLAVLSRILAGSPAAVLRF